MRVKKVVYRHRRLDDNSIFYIGIGNSKRPYCKHGRNTHWNRIINKTDYKVEIVANDLSLEDYPNIYFVGDALSARGITVSGAQGTYVAESILKSKVEDYPEYAEGNLFS